MKTNDEVTPQEVNSQLVELVFTDFGWAGDLVKGLKLLAMGLIVPVSRLLLLLTSPISSPLVSSYLNRKTRERRARFMQRVDNLHR